MFRPWLLCIIIPIFSAVSTLDAQTPSVTLYINENFDRGFTFTQNTPVLRSPIFGQASSIKAVNADDKWVVLWESVNFNTDDDQLWIQGSRDISILGSNIPRPHGNNSWNDLIKGVSFPSAGPWDGNDNRTVCFHGQPCVNQPIRRVQENPVLASPVPEHPGWFVRVCRAQSDPGLEGLSFSIGAGHNDDSHHHWRDWKNDGSDPATFSVPGNFLYVHDVWMEAGGTPAGKQVSLCLGFRDHITRKYTFTSNEPENHQPDQDDQDSCEC